jgi:CheY-like chemotaxis protein
MTTSSFPYRILFVEDDPGLRQVGFHVLKSQGYEVLVAEDGFDALIALKRSLPDVIISDLRMPNMNGFEFLSVVRRRFPTIPVIVISGEFSGLTIPECVLADAFFAKGQYKNEELFAKIESFLQDLPDAPASRTVRKSCRVGKEPQGHTGRDLHAMSADVPGRSCLGRGERG